MNTSTLNTSTMDISTNYTNTCPNVHFQNSLSFIFAFTSMIMSTFGLCLVVVAWNRFNNTRKALDNNNGKVLNKPVVINEDDLVELLKVRYNKCTRNKSSDENSDDENLDVARKSTLGFQTFTRMQAILSDNDLTEDKKNEQIKLICFENYADIIRRGKLRNENQSNKVVYKFNDSTYRRFLKNENINEGCNDDFNDELLLNYWNDKNNSN